MPSLNIDKLTKIVVDFLHQEGDEYNTFIETGTLMGDTTINLQPYFQNIHTIELSEKYYNLSFERIKELGIENVKCYFGDSSEIIPEILPSLTSNDKCIFFLDGHWSSGDTAKGNKDCPLIEECLSINLLYLSDEALILIDDYRMFDTKVNEDWSNINVDSIKNCFDNFEIVNECVVDDVFSLHIKKIKK